MQRKDLAGVGYEHRGVINLRAKPLCETRDNIHTGLTRCFRKHIAVRTRNRCGEFFRRGACPTEVEAFRKHRDTTADCSRTTNHAVRAFEILVAPPAFDEKLSQTEYVLTFAYHVVSPYLSDRFIRTGTVHPFVGMYHAIQQSTG